MRNKKLQVWLPLVFSIVMIVGMFFGYKLGKQGNAGSNFFASNKRTSLQEALDLIRIRYVDSINIDSLEGKAIQEMMSELDPHSVYFPPVELKEADEELKGKFDGIGVEFQVYSDTVNVVFVIPGGPSEKSGLRIGDKILKVDDSTLVGRKYTVNEIKDRIRGSRGSMANLQVFRQGKIIPVSIVRGSIPVPSIDAVYMIDKTTGYIRLTKFTDQSYEEFMEAMENLQKQGMQSLVYDLRGNGGGFMNEAVDMADEFLDGNKLIVYTEGVNSRKKEYRCKRKGIFETGSLVVLVDELSASASEVLAGALQDWCRAKIIGRRTFGKGLVQEQYSLSDGSALRLTVARYYTPIGRSIQRSYEKGKKVYMDELWERFSNGEVLNADSAKHHNGKAYPTICRDTVYGGDGITPNYFVPLDTVMLRSSTNSFDPRLGYFVYQWYLEHAKDIEQYSNSAEFAKKFNIDKMWNDFLLHADTTKARAAGLTVPQKQAVQRLMKSLLARYRWRNTGFFQVLNENDPAVAKAVEVIEGK